MERIIWHHSYILKKEDLTSFPFWKKTDADIIALQEVTPPFSTELLNQPWVQDNYFVSDIGSTSILPSGNFILSKIPLMENFIYHFTKSPKSIVISKLSLNNKKFVIANVHLKAGPTSQCGWIREREINDTMDIVNKLGFDDCVIVGDFNFCANENEVAKKLEDQYIDVWVHLMNDHPGYTHDITQNALIQEIAKAMYGSLDVSDAKSDRFDRIYISKKENPNWTMGTISLIGTDPIGTSDDGRYNLFLSDHFGLITTLYKK